MAELSGVQMVKSTFRIDEPGKAEILLTVLT